jgi:hypothetical protein
VLLAYGKFDPDLNPIPFSDWSKAYGAVEIDLIQFFQWKPKVSEFFKKWILKNELMIIPRLSIRTQREADEYLELFQIWEESFKDQTLYYSIYSGRKKWEPEYALKELKKLPPEQRYCFEWAQEDRLENSSFLFELHSFSTFVVDPHWHLKQLKKLENIPLRFKLHGWNEERWVRRYGMPLISKISRTIASSELKSLVLSYSGKTEEAVLFKSAGAY